MTNLEREISTTFAFGENFGLDHHPLAFSFELIPKVRRGR